MSRQVAEQFIKALHKLEEDRELDPIVATYSEDCEVGNIIVPEKFKGPDGARRFWSEYRDTFGEIHSSFRNVIASDGSAALEWTTKATSADGDPLEYDGVSILEIADGKVTRFRAYFNPRSLGRQMENGE